MDKIELIYKNNSASFLADNDGTSMNFKSFKNAIKEYKESFSLGAVVKVDFADKNFLEGINKAIQVCNELDDGDCNEESHFYYEALDNVKSHLQEIKINFTA